MKFNVGSTPLLLQLQAVSKVINSKNVISVLDNFLLEIEGNMLTITGSDKENTIRAQVEIEMSEGDGKIAIPAKGLLDALREVPNQGITFYVNEDTLEVEIQYLNGHMNFTGVNGNDFPKKENLSEEGVVEFTIPASVILNGIEKTLFAAATETLRPVMTGIFWDVHPEDITFVSSDSHKLVRYINKKGAPGVETSFIMPAKPANILKSIIGKEDQLVTVKRDAKGAVFSLKGIELSCLFINGNFPNYNRVIPQNNPFALVTDRVSLLQALKRVSLSASQASLLVSLNINPDEVLISARDLDNAKSAEERLSCSYEGNVMKIGFNSEYIIEELTNLTGDNVMLRLSEPSRPGLFMPEVQDEDEELLMLLMPLNTFE